MLLAFVGRVDFFFVYIGIKKSYVDTIWVDMDPEWMELSPPFTQNTFGLTDDDEYHFILFDIHTYILTLTKVHIHFWHKWPQWLPQKKKKCPDITNP